MDEAVMESAVPTKLVAPSIGAQWQGGIYLGILRGEPNQPDYHLVVASLAEHAHEVRWQHAMDMQNRTVINGFSDWQLPNRREMRLAHVNAPENFATDSPYWTSAQNEFTVDCAWAQWFGDGYQYGYRKSIEFSVAFVRRISVIQ